MIRSKAATFCALVTLLGVARANDGAPPYTFEGSVGPVMELNDQGMPSLQALPEEAKPAAPAPVVPPANAPARIAPPPPVSLPAPVAAPATGDGLPAHSAPIVQPVQTRAAPTVVTPVTTSPPQWQTPAQGKSPFADQEPAKIFENEPPRPCTKETFDRGLCVAR